MDTGHLNTVSKTEEENSSEMGGGFVDDLKSSTRSKIESLPDDVVFEILARVPARDIHSAARLVCHKWYQTTRTHDFVRAHLHQSTCSGLVIQPFGSDIMDSMFATQKGLMSDFGYKFTGSILSSCNGLILESHFKDPGWEFRVINPATKQHLVLPSICMTSNYNLVGMGLAYAVASKEYKVVCPFYSHSRETAECAILTVGVDEDWKRRVDIRHLSRPAKDTLFSTQTPLSTDGGFLHWTSQDISGRDSEFVVTLNVETEIITHFPAPPRNLCGEEKKDLLYLYLPMGSCVSLLIARIDQNKPFPIWDQVWVMKPETGEWTKMNMSIDSESLKRAFQQGVNDHIFYPVGWLKSQEVLVFAWYSSSSCIAYNVRTHEIESSLELGFIPCTIVAHQNSLVWLDSKV